jgi:virulence factor BrkB
VWIGAAVASLLLTTGKALLGLYFAKSTVVSAYGAAASLVVILTWVYYSVQIFLLGAEVTHVYSYSSFFQISREETAVTKASGRSASHQVLSDSSRYSCTPGEFACQFSIAHWLTCLQRVIEGVRVIDTCPEGRMPKKWAECGVPSLSNPFEPSSERVNLNNCLEGWRPRRDLNPRYRRERASLRWISL